MEVTIVRSNRKTYSIQVNPDLSVTVRVPRSARRSEIERVLREKEDWIQRSLEKMQLRREKLVESGYEKLSETEISELKKQAASYISERVRYFSEIVGVSYGRITIRIQKTRWGSCSAKGNLNFNALLMLMPKEVIDYVVVHELCHRKEMNHGRAFWVEVEKVIPDYRKYRKWLKENGSGITARAVTEK